MRVFRYVSIKSTYSLILYLRTQRDSVLQEQTKRQSWIALFTEIVLEIDRKDDPHFMLKLCKSFSIFRWDFPKFFIILHCTFPKNFFISDRFRLRFLPGMRGSQQLFYNLIVQKKSLLPTNIFRIQRLTNTFVLLLFVLHSFELILTTPISHVKLRHF